VNKRYIVTLTAEERVMLEDLIRSGTAAARKIAHARTPLVIGAPLSSRDLHASPYATGRQITRALQRYVQMNVTGSVRAL
jgi:aspartate oxidase